MSAEEALEHKWLVEESMSPEVKAELDQDVIAKLI
jgi:hypothetical protein